MVIAAVANGQAARLPLTAALASRAALLPVILAQQERHFQIERLDPPARAKVLAALAGLIILMLGLMLLAWMGARWARAYGHRTPLSFERRAKPVLDPDDWAGKPLRPDDPGEDPSP
jgi:hypothetical protein